MSPAAGATTTGAVFPPGLGLIAGERAARRLSADLVICVDLGGDGDGEGGGPAVRAVSSPAPARTALPRIRAALAGAAARTGGPVAQAVVM